VPVWAIARVRRRFSFLDHSNRPIGYSLELCEAIVEEIGVEVDDANLRIEHVKVTSD